MSERVMGFVCINRPFPGIGKTRVGEASECVPLAMVDEPAKCDSCGKVMVNPTFAQIFADCECGGRFHTIYGAAHTTRESLMAAGTASALDTAASTASPESPCQPANTLTQDGSHG